MRTNSPDPALPSEQERVGRAVAVLSPLEREVLVLSAGHGLRNADIAVRLGIAERRAERVLARALRKFSRVMEQADHRSGRR